MGLPTRPRRGLMREKIIRVEIERVPVDRMPLAWRLAYDKLLAENTKEGAAK